MTIDNEIRRLAEQVASLRAQAEREPKQASRELTVPDIVEFCLSDRYLRLPTIYPRQVTLLKMLFLQDELFTQYDLEVIEEWGSGFTLSDPSGTGGPPDRAYRHYEGNEGLAPDVLHRIRTLKDQGRPWFHECVLALGRRAGKGVLGAIAGAYVTWTFLAMGDPHAQFGILPGTTLVGQVFAGNYLQARANQWLAIAQVLVRAPCFAPYLTEIRADKVIIATPADLANEHKILTGSIEIGAKETTPLAGRGAAAFMQFYDEMAHVDGATAKSSVDDLYDAATPALDQFGDYGFIFEPSSPRYQTGRFFENYQRALQVNVLTGEPVYPEVLTAQLPSWAPYQDWERAHHLPVVPSEVATRVRVHLDAENKTKTFPPLSRAIQSYDDRMRQHELRDPVHFAVERRAHWASVADALLHPHDVERIFAPYEGRVLDYRDRGALSVDYIAHGDPAVRHDNFAWMIGHRSGPDANGLHHFVVDHYRVWKPEEFPDNEIDLLSVVATIVTDIVAFGPRLVTFDQFQGAAITQLVTQEVRKLNLGRPPTIDEQPHTHSGNRALAQTFVQALHLERVHSPPCPQLEEELRFLTERSGTIAAPTSGPVQTDDLAITLMVLVSHALGDGVGLADQQALSEFELRSYNYPFGQPTPDEASLFAQLGNPWGDRPPRGSNPARPHRFR